MNRFIYYLPGVPGCNDEMLRERGLMPRFMSPAGILEHGITAWREGPAGHGVAVAVGCEPARYDPDAQIWMECGRFWIGCDAGGKPGPLDLQREIGHAGYDMRLLDGNEWRVPRLRKWNAEKLEHESALPKVLRAAKGPDGKFGIRPCVALQYEPLDTLAENIWQAFLGQMPWDADLVFSTAVQLLSENYRIGMEEASVLGLLDEPTAFEVLRLSIDLPGIESAATDMAADGLHFAEECSPLPC